MATCRYHNVSDRLVILRCIGPNAFFQEKVLFPNEDWLFVCPAHSTIEVWTHSLAGAELLDRRSSEELLFSTRSHGACDLAHSAGVAR
jgi:hypothetical protein